MNKARGLFLVFCSSYIIGDVLGCLEDFRSMLLGVGALLLLFVFQGLYRAIFLSALLALSIGYYFGQEATRTQTEKYLALQDITENFTQKGEISGVVDAFLFQKERSKVYRLLIANFANFANTGVTLSEKGIQGVSLFIEVPLNLDISRGDSLKFSGKIENIIEFPLRGYSRYAYFQGGFGSVYVPSFERISTAESGLLDNARVLWSAAFERYFPRDIAGTLLGMTIGKIDILSKEVKTAFTNSGTSHILVVSGANIAFLLIMLGFFLKYFSISKYLRWSIVICFLLFYGFLVGWEVSIVRALFMGVLSYFIVEHGGRSSSRATLGLAGLILTFWSPLAPLYDAGFGLSFGATLGIILFHKKIEIWCRQYHIPHTLTSIISVSIGALLGSLPLMIYHFERIPVATLVANLMIGWLLGWILFSSVFFVVIQGLSHTLGIIFGFLVYLPTKFIIFVSSFFQYGYIIHIPSNIVTPLTLFLLGILFFFFIEPEQKKGS